MRSQVNDAEPWVLRLLPDESAEPGRVTVSCAGTVVYDDLCELELVDFHHSPWSSGRLTGMLDFGGFEVVPGTRRGVLPNDAAASCATSPHCSPRRSSCTLSRTRSTPPCWSG